MSTAGVFESKALKKYEKNGQLAPLFKQLGNYFNEKDLVGTGGDASTFNYDKKLVIKICSKRAKYFRHLDKNLPKTGETFKIHSQKLAPYFLPAVEILYDDDAVFVYTQRIAQLWDKKTLDKSMIRDLFRATDKMLKNDLVTNITGHNLAIVDDKIVIFDYHAMKPINWEDINDWWESLLRHLTEYLSYVYAPSQIIEYESLMRSFNKKAYEKINSDGHLPITFMTFLKYVLDNSKPTKIKILEHLDQCSQFLRKDIHCHDKSESESESESEPKCKPKSE